MNSVGNDHTWRTSSYTGANNNCVEIARLDEATCGVRDSKLGASSPVLTFGSAAWSAFLTTLKSGQLDG